MHQTNICDTLTSIEIQCLQFHKRFQMHQTNICDMLTSIEVLRFQIHKLFQMHHIHRGPAFLDSQAISNVSNQHHSVWYDHINLLRYSVYLQIHQYSGIQQAKRKR